MRNTPNLNVERYRVREGRMASSRFDGNNGAWQIPHNGATLTVISSDGLGWEHVSVSLPNRCPTWEEMCHVKWLFWNDDECVIQYHPPRSEYVNEHPFCLHLWKPIGVELPLPDSLMVGPKNERERRELRAAGMMP